MIEGTCICMLYLSRCSVRATTLLLITSSQGIRQGVQQQAAQCLNFHLQDKRLEDGKCLLQTA